MTGGAEQAMLETANALLRQGRIIDRLSRLLTVTSLGLLVGGSILVHGMAQLGQAGPEHFIHDVSEGVVHTLALAPAVVGWLTTSALQALLAIAVGAATIIVMGNVVAPLWSRLRPARS